MTENQGYYVSEGWYQTLTDFTSAVAKGTLTKARMGELATVHLDQLKGYAADGIGETLAAASSVDELKDFVSEIDRLRGLEKDLRKGLADLTIHLQQVSGCKGAPATTCLARLWEVRECVDALFKLPSKAGVRDALARVIGLRACLVECQAYIDEVTSAFDNAVRGTNAPEVDAQRFSALVAKGHDLSDDIEALARPKLADVS